MRDSRACVRETFFSRSCIFDSRVVIVVVCLVVIASSSSTRVFCLPSLVF